jgi:hypothetical protein
MAQGLRGRFHRLYEEYPLRFEMRNVVVRVLVNRLVDMIDRHRVAHCHRNDLYYFVNDLA